jgi:quercetin dioxygenase-like cupin family protein
MNFANIFRSASRPSKPTFERIEKRLQEAHRDLRQYVASIDMCYEEGGVQHLPISTDWTQFCTGVRQVECQLPTRNSTLLNVVFELGSTIPRHRHAEQREEIFVVEGAIEDFDTGIVTESGGVYVIQAGAYHTIHARKGALLNVLFRPKFRRRAGDK